MDSPDGMVKIIADRNDRILGAHVLGPCGSDLIAEITLAMTKGLTAADVAELDPHPSDPVRGRYGSGFKSRRPKAIHALN